MTAPQLQRSLGDVRLSVRRDGAFTRVQDAYQAGSAKVRLPKAASENALEAILINTSGGLTDGDRFDQYVRAEEGAQLSVTTQACEKAYRGRGEPATLYASLTVEDGASLSWLPQPTIFFDHAGLDRLTEVHLAHSAQFLGVEALILGRTHMGELVRQGTLRDRWRLHRDGVLLQADDVRANGDLSAIFGAPVTLAGLKAYATCFYVAGDAEARLDAVRGAIASLKDSVAAASAWEGRLVARFAAADGQALTRALIHFLTQFRGQPMPRPWLL